MMKNVHKALPPPDTSWRRKRSLSTAITVQIQRTQRKNRMIVPISSRNGRSASATSIAHLSVGFVQPGGCPDPVGRASPCRGEAEVLGSEHGLQRDQGRAEQGEPQTHQQAAPDREPGEA